MPIKSGTYIIVNIESRNLALLSDANDGTPLQASPGEDFPSERWEVKRHKNGCYSIASIEHQGRFANCGDRPLCGTTVDGNDQKQLWIIEEYSDSGRYTIAPMDAKLFWALPDNGIGTPITLHDVVDDPQCWWNFEDPETGMDLEAISLPSTTETVALGATSVSTANEGINSGNYIIQSAPAVNTKSNLRIASFDAGGIRNLSQLEIMGHIMYRLARIKFPDDPEKVVLPCGHFDLIGGCDTGGLVAIMLTKLQMSVEEATEEFSVIVERAYANHLEPAERTKMLKRCMEDLLDKRGQPRGLKLEDEEQSSPCAGFTLVTPCNNTGVNVCLRTYHVKNERPSGITVIDAVLATCASQPHFLPASFGEGHRKLEYIGAGLGTSNPIRYVIHEAQSLFGIGSSISSLLSLGSGHPGITVLVPDGGVDALHQVMVQMMEDCEQTAQEIQRQIGRSGIYFRFSVDQGVQRHQPTQGDELSWIYAQTISYLNIPDTEDKVEDYLRSVVAERAVTGLHQLGGLGGLNLAQCE